VHESSWRVVHESSWNNSLLLPHLPVNCATSLSSRHCAGLPAMTVQVITSAYSCQLWRQPSTQQGAHRCCRCWFWRMRSCCMALRYAPSQRLAIAHSYVLQAEHTACSCIGHHCVPQKQQTVIQPFPSNSTATPTTQTHTSAHKRSLCVCTATHQRCLHVCAQKTTQHEPAGTWVPFNLCRPPVK
jgi:hypothetical protein